MKGTFKGLMIAAASFAAASASAGGYEKNILWSGKHAGVGGIGASHAKGAEALYFNPAGLGGAQNWEVSANFSPTFAKFEGPIVKNDLTEPGDRGFIPAFGLLASYGVTEELGVGLGVYAAGGSKNKFKSVNFADANAAFTVLGNREVSSNLQLLEASLGAGYKITPNWSLGASWRVTMVRAEFSTFEIGAIGTGTLIHLNMADLSTTKWNGFRVGTQYRADDNAWGVGASFRSNLDFTAKGRSSGSFENPFGPASGDVTGGDVSITNSFPMQVSIGGDYAFLSDKSLRVFLEYAWTNYSKDKVLDINGSVNVGGTDVPLSDITQNWNDLQNIRLGFEWTGIENLPIRLGYVMTGLTTPKAHARATFVAPGVGHTFALGAGTSLMDKALDLDAAVEYSVAKGEVEGQQDIGGKFTTDAFAAHLGATYRF